VKQKNEKQTGKGKIENEFRSTESVWEREDDSGYQKDDDEWTG
jgi:hypothetical protein